MTPSSRPATAATTLKRLPGAYWPWMTRFMSGVSGSLVRLTHRAGSMPLVKPLGSKAGSETMPRISPVWGSSATALPARPPKACSMAACSRPSRVSVRLGPSRGSWRSASATSTPRLLTTTLRKPSRPIRRWLYWASSPAWPTRSPGWRWVKAGCCSWASLISPTRPSEWAAAEASG